MTNKLAGMHELAAQLTEAVAKRMTSGKLHDKALRDLGAFVHRTVVDDEHTCAVRIDDGAMLDAGEQVDHARPHLNDAGRGQAAAVLGRQVDRLDELRARQGPGAQTPHHARDARPRPQRTVRVRPFTALTASLTSPTCDRANSCRSN
jgi:hypothetical protein